MANFDIFCVLMLVLFDGSICSTTYVKIVNREGNTKWLYTVQLLEIPEWLEINDVYMQHYGLALSDDNELLNDNWIHGIYYKWGNYYAFDENGPFEPPFSFKLIGSNGQTIISRDVINSLRSGASGTMDQSFSESYKTADSNDGHGIIGIVIVVILSILVLFSVVIAIMVYKKRKRNKSVQKTTGVSVTNPMDQKKEFEIIDTENAAGDQETNDKNLFTMKNRHDWNESRTEQLEHELEKAVATKQYSVNSGDTDRLDDILDDESSEDDRGERKPANLFRYKSKKSWGVEELEEQADEMRKQMKSLSPEQQDGDT